MLKYVFKHRRSFIALTILGVTISTLLCLKNGFDIDYVIFGMVVGWGWWALCLVRFPWWPPV